MKIRYYVILVAFILFAGICGVHHFMYAKEYRVVNMVSINEKTTKISKALHKNIDNRQKLQKKYHCTIIFCDEEKYEEIVNNAIVDQNTLIDYVDDGKILGKIIFSGQRERNETVFYYVWREIVFIFIIIFVVLCIILLLIYLRYVRPFIKMQGFAIQIAKGNFDVPLNMTKQNYFGAFTESFDIMREELKIAKQGEYEANQSKKELVAGLSHDIKTPVATIKALCEILMLQIKEEAQLKKISTINQKANMIDTLITDMFQATLEDLQVLKSNPSEEPSTIIQDMFVEINHYNKIHFSNQLPECLIFVDKLRLNQVIDNVINNSYKYANTDIEVEFEIVMLDEVKKIRGLKIRIRDFGEGVAEEEYPLLTEKFYRGENTKNKSGSGLGLYLAKTFMLHMNGEFECYGKDGFVVEIIVLCV